DPGADIAGATPFNHISAAVIAEGGVVGTPPTVTGVTYLNPTTVRLTLDTTSSTANLAGQKYSVSIMNPDGQVITGSNILQVVQASSATLSGSISGLRQPKVSGITVKLAASDGSFFV